MSLKHFKARQVQFFNKLAHDRGFHPVLEYSEWYSVPASDITKFKGGKHIVNRHNGHKHALVHTYDAVPFDLSKFSKRIVNDNFSGLQKGFYNRLAHEANFHPYTECAKWFEVSHNDISKYKSSWKHLNHFRSYFTGIVRTYFPLIHVCFFNTVAHSLGFHPVLESERWYSIRKEDLEPFRGRWSILEAHASYTAAIVATYPSTNLDISRFGYATHEARKAFLGRVSHDLGFHHTKDLSMWHSLSMLDVLSYSGSHSALAGYTTLQQAIAELYTYAPTATSSPVKPIKYKVLPENGATGNREERVLYNALTQLFPSAQILLNSQKESFLLYPKQENARQKYRELDAWIPSLNLGFEYQEDHHYSSKWRSKVPLRVIQLRDAQKAEMMKQMGKTLITVPYWWDKTKESLAATIREQRPELLLDFAETDYVISNAPPESFFRETSIPDVGELMIACFFEYKQNITNWWMGEKFDGIRACWNPKRRAIYSRNGKPLSLLGLFYQRSPVVSVDGELWFGRQNFAVACQIPALKPTNPDISTDYLDIDWSLLRYIVFDSPSFKDLEYEIRYKYMLQFTISNHSFINPNPRLMCHSTEFMETYTKTVILMQGEGCILRLPCSLYEQGNSTSVLKVKLMVDAEAKVVATDGNSYTCKLPNNGTLVALKRPKVFVQIGDIVEFTTLPNPKCATKSNHMIVRVRQDLTWDEVLYNYSRRA